ncbi:MAG: multicopper oxidase domain-containing protein [Acidobacteria bacterium]|nr:multicopper oxidase domain-containing protein [Acidobacteriota bacterium]
MSSQLSRRSLLQVTGLSSLGAAALSLIGARGLRAANGLAADGLAADGLTANGAAAGGSATSGSTQPAATYGHAGHSMITVGRVSTDDFNPTTFLRTWNFSDLPPGQRETVYRETRRPDGSRLREYDLFAIDREIEIAPGLFFPAWTYNGQVPGPTIRATEGDRLRINFVNQGSHPHTIHFHGWHRSEMDGSLPDHQVMPGDKFVYEFDAEPFGLHLYHCHANPLKRHIHKGLYGAFLIDPKGGRPPADELVMVMNGFDTNFDADNEVYAVNTVAHHYMHEPIRVTVGKPVRMYLINVTEFDVLNSLHLHAVFFDVFRTGTSLTPSEVTDTIMLCQGERAILETAFRYPGQFMFHAHQSEFAELGWMGLFRAQEPNRET